MQKDVWIGKTKPFLFGFTQHLHEGGFSFWAVGGVGGGGHGVRGSREGMVC